MMCHNGKICNLSIMIDYMSGVSLNKKSAFYMIGSCVFVCVCVYVCARVCMCVRAVSSDLLSSS